MYTNLEIGNVKAHDEVEIEGEVMLMRTQDYAPSAQSAFAKIMKRAGKFVCQFEIASDAELFITEGSSTDLRSCFESAERKMREKINLWRSPAQNHFAPTY